MAKEVHFDSEQAAQIALKQCDFALGTSQRDSPRGIMFECDGVEKWRNLSANDKSELHGVYQRQYRDGPVQITITEQCPQPAADALSALGSNAT